MKIGTEMIACRNMLIMNALAPFFIFEIGGNWW
jgi:hypothetical protein